MKSKNVCRAALSTLRPAREEITAWLVARGYEMGVGALAVR